MSKSLKQQRIERYFIDATKQIIEEEGVDQVSARKVAEIAGYSYATIYNYFKDINTLLTYTAIDYLQSSHDIILSRTSITSNPLQSLVSYAKEYFNYMVENPNLFKIIFIQPFGEVPYEVSKELMPKSSIWMREKLAECDQSKFIGTYSQTYELLSASMHGKLLFIVSERAHIKKQVLLNQIEQEIKLLLGVEK